MVSIDNCNALSASVHIAALLSPTGRLVLCPKAGKSCLAYFNIGNHQILQEMENPACVQAPVPCASTPAPGLRAQQEQLVLSSAGDPRVSPILFPRWWLSRVTELHRQEHRDQPVLCKAEQGLGKGFVLFVLLNPGRMQTGSSPLTHGTAFICDRDNITRLLQIVSLVLTPQVLLLRFFSF